MAKGKSTDRKVSEFTHHDSGIVVEIRLEHTTFYANVLEKKFEAADASILKADVEDFLTHWLKLEYFPIIQVEIDEASGSSWRRSRDEKEIFKEGLSVELTRFYITRSPAGRIMQVNWSVEPENRKGDLSIVDTENEAKKIRLIGLPLKAPIEMRCDRYWIAYTDDLWATLDGIVKNLKTLREKITGLCSTKTGVMALMGGNAGFALEDKK